MSPTPSSARPPRSGRRLLATLLAAALTGLLPAAAAAQAQAGADPWSLEEQQFLYDLNRARWDPASAGLADKGVLPAPPLALSNTLATAAGFRSDEMAHYEYFAHQSPVTGLWPNAVARQYGYPLPPYWPDDANSIESIHYGQPRVAGVLQDLLNSPPHRAHLMGQGWFGTHREVGVGANLGERIWTAMTANDGTAAVFLTGVVFRDANASGSMDPGEGLGGVTVTAGRHSTVSNPAGGWVLRVPPRTYRVRAAGAGFDGTPTARVTVGAFNVAVDFVSGLRRPLVHSYETCNGLPPTIIGTAGRDVIKGTPGNDVIVGGGGRDVIRGLGGRDTICGGDGDDVLYGGAGRDILIGGPGSDRCMLGEEATGCESS